VNRMYENSYNLLWVASVYLAAAAEKNTNIRNIILAKLSSCKGQRNECKGSKNELQKANKVHRNSRSTTIHFI
jgi:hypothetical protein